MTVLLNRRCLMIEPVEFESYLGFYLRRGWTEVGTARQQRGHRSVDAVLMILAASL